MQMMATACGLSSSRSGSSPGNVSPGLAAANPDQRAALVVKADELTIQRPPRIPNVQPATVPVLGKSLSDAVSSSAYLFSPWADQLGGAG
jgi:hypothetical protein